MANWFGDLDLAYKYIVVFLSLLVITILGGFIKVLYNRQKLKKAKQAELEAGPKEDTVELNQREKDEGDLFGIRAIQAGFYAGVAQSRPTSRAGSVMGDNPTMSTSTLVGGSVNSPLMKGQSNNNNSMLSLNLNATKEPNTRRVSPPTMKLRPSEAELSGRHNHNGAVDMSLHVPPSPGHPPNFTGSDSDSDGFTSPRSMSPADLNRQQYAPALMVSHHTGDENVIRSQQGSYHNSPGQSPTPLSPRNPPTAKLPSIPGHAMRKESRSPSPEYDYPRVQVHEPNSEPSSSAPQPQPRLQARTYSPQHERDASDASSIYSSGNRLSTFSAYQAYQKDAQRKDAHEQVLQKQRAGRSASAASTVESGHTSILASTDDKAERRSQSSSLLAPGQQGKDTRLSEFYEAYYRNSHLGSAHPGDVKKQTAERQSTIMEVDTPLASPMFPPSQRPGSVL